MYIAYAISNLIILYTAILVSAYMILKSPFCLYIFRYSKLRFSPKHPVGFFCKCYLQPCSCMAYCHDAIHVNVSC